MLKLLVIILVEDIVADVIAKLLCDTFNRPKNKEE